MLRLAATTQNVDAQAKSGRAKVMDPESVLQVIEANTLEINVI